MPGECLAGGNRRLLALAAGGGQYREDCAVRTLVVEVPVTYPYLDTRTCNRRAHRCKSEADETKQAIEAARCHAMGGDPGPPALQHAADARRDMARRPGNVTGLPLRAVAVAARPATPLTAGMDWGKKQRAIAGTGASPGPTPRRAVTN